MYPYSARSVKQTGCITWYETLPEGPWIMFKDVIDHILGSTEARKTGMTFLRNHYAKKIKSRKDKKMEA